MSSSESIRGDMAYSVCQGEVRVYRVNELAVWREYSAYHYRTTEMEASGVNEAPEENLWLNGTKNNSMQARSTKKVSQSGPLEDVRRPYGRDASARYARPHSLAARIGTRSSSANPCTTSSAQAK